MVRLFSAQENGNWLFGLNAGTCTQLITDLLIAFIMLDTNDDDGDGSLAFEGQTDLQRWYHCELLLFYCWGHKFKSNQQQQL